MLWKESGTPITYEEVLAAKAALKELLSTLDDPKYRDEKRQALDVMHAMTRMEYIKMPPEMKAEELRKARAGYNH